jgi:hypothetical protein
MLVERRVLPVGLEDSRILANDLGQAVSCHSSEGRINILNPRLRIGDHNAIRGLGDGSRQGGTIRFQMLVRGGMRMGSHKEV